MDLDPTALAIRDALWLTVSLAGPSLVALLAIGLAVSVLQALTQVQEPSLVFLPKLCVLALVLLLLGPGMVGAMRAYAARLFDRVVAIGGLS